MSLLDSLGSRKQQRDYVVVSVGGSLIVPDKIDTTFLKQFRSFVLGQIDRGVSFFIITGGGATARRYRDAGIDAHGGLERDDLDWLGIHATRLNAHLMRALFRDEAQERIIKNPTKRLSSRAPVIVGAGWRPGWSTDYCAVMAAKQLGAARLVNLSDIDYVYDKNPKEFPDAKKLETVDWKTFRGLIPDRWDPGLSSPFDPIAAKEAEAIGLEVAVISGHRLDDLDKYLKGEPFVGTVIR